MDEWDELCYPGDEEDYEDRYADELEAMNDIGGAGPTSRKSLKFTDQPEQPLQPVTHDNVKTSEQDTASKKRPNDDMYGTISDDHDDDDDDDDNMKTSPDLDMDILGPHKKKSRHTSPGTKDFHDLNGNTSPILTDIKKYNKTVSPLQKNAIHLSKNEHSPLRSVITSGQSSEHRAFTRPPMGKESITVTQTDGQRLYLCIKDDPKEKQSSKPSQMRHSSLQLLQVPFNVIRQHVDEERRRKLTEESDRITASLRRALQNGSEDTDCMDTSDDRMNHERRFHEHVLWVEKYSPKLFTELLSDDAINRTLLKWLKLWDKVVFNKQNKGVGKSMSAKQTKEDEKQKSNQYGKGNKKFSKGGIESEEWIEVDSNGHPAHKVALLCGPPGLGKTTLAHVIARHAGYNVVEMNASDDRTADVFKQKIETATQMKSVLGSNERPNCLVIDEIDGAPVAAINVLLSFIKKKDSDGAKKTKRKKVQTLSRPIICICNDQFVPSLRQLRQQALVAVFPKTIPGRLSTRLNEISRREGIKTDMTTLLALCDKADNDIRSCLNTLQFVHRRHGCLSMHHVQTNDVGQKDLHKNLFTIMQEIFQLPKAKKKRFAGFKDNMRQANESREFLNSLGIYGETGLPEKSVSPLTSRFHNTLRSASACGQFDKLAQGLFENYLNIKYKDSGLNALVSGTQWLEFADIIEQQVNASQQYTLRRYSPFLSVAFHLLYATPSSSKLSYPSSQYECYIKQVKMSSLITTMKSEASPQIRSAMDQRIACLDLFPLFLEIITPNMRPVNMQLFSSREKQQMAELIDSMIAYNVTYHQERNFEGQYSYVLDPNIEEVVKFPSLPQHKQLPYATKQLIAREIDLEKMRRAEKVIRSRYDGANTPVTPFPPKAQKAAKPESRVIKHVKEKVALDFFGQPIKQKKERSSTEGSNSNNPPADNSAKLIWFKFNEGYSNAVRKNVKVQDLL